MFKKLTLSVVLEEFGRIELNLIKTDDFSFIIEKNDFIEGGLVIEKSEGSYILNSNIKIIPGPPHEYFRSFDAFKGIILELTAEENSYTRGLALQRYNPFWTKPVFFKDFSELSDNTQQILIEGKSEYIHIMPISSSAFQSCARSNGSKNTLTLTAGTFFGGSGSMCGAVAVISSDANPYTAVGKSYTAACENGVIITPPKEDKQFPKALEGLGWCTWDAFYQDVTAQGIEEKLKEFKKNDIPVKWIMIDDGWAQTNGFKLVSRFADKNKFPDGLKAFISHIKKEYGIEYVGIWHSFTGYWLGIDKTSELYKKNKELFIDNNSNLTVIGQSYEKAYEFYSQWHKYLRGEGIDFLKVDGQGNANEFYKNMPNPGQAVINMHNALEQSVLENFDGTMINCMGLGSLDMFSRKTSAVVRNSDDFIPGLENGFRKHVIQNAYNAVFNSKLFYCDYDMWHTVHPNAEQNSVLRAVSGGPVYVSDGLDKTNSKYLLPLLSKDKKIIRCDNAAMPTADCIFQNPQNGVLKIFNTAGENFVIAVFNLSNEEKEVKISLKDIFTSGSFYMHMYFAKKCDFFKDGMTVGLAPSGVEVINLYKTDENGRVRLGDTEKYVSVATL